MPDSSAVAAPKGVPPAAHGWRSLAERFAGVLARDPHRAAVVAVDATLTFAELDRRSAAVAAAVTARGLGPESVAGVCLPRSADLVVALLGLVRAGVAYLPLDPRLPAGRIAEMLRESRVSTVLVDAGTGAEGPMPEVEPLRPAECASGKGFRDAEVYPDTLMYAMYTSGSTGRPKCVAVSHGGVTDLLDALESAGVVDGGPGRVGWNASVSFDASVQQWTRIFRGDTVVVLDERVRADPVELAAFARAEALTDLDITPTHLETLLEHVDPDGNGVPSRLLVGGEAVSPALWHSLCRLTGAGRVRAVNLYGPTECTVDATVAEIAPGTAPHIGEPLPGVRMYLLDAGLRAVPDGTAGEVYLAGARVARGYHGMPGETATRFVADPFSVAGERMYRTGDWARRRADGRLEFLGRTDSQVKLRGNRVELTEIEAVLAALPGVAQVAVALREDCPGGRGIAAYYRAVAPVDAAALRTAAAERLPEYMVPAVFVAVDRLPTTLSGKVDRARLPAPASPEPGARPPYRPPSSRNELLVAAAWSAVLGVERIGSDDNFFHLGGQSLLAIRVAARLRRASGHVVPLVAVFENPRLRDLAAHLDRLSAPGVGS